MHYVHSDDSDEGGRKFEELCHQGRYFLVFNKNMANLRGLFLKILGGLLFPCVVWTYGEFILILLKIDVWILRSQKRIITCIVAVLFQVHEIENIYVLLFYLN